MVVIGLIWLYSGENGCILDKMVLFGQKCLYLGNVVLFGQNSSYSGKYGCILAKVVVFG